MCIHLRVWQCVSAASILAALGLSPVAAAQEHDHHRGSADRISLDEIVERIATENPSVRAARLHADALATLPDQVSAWPDPTLSVGYQPMPMLTAHGAQRSEWMVEQMVPYPGKLALREEIATLDARSAIHESEALVEDLVLEAKEAYFELYRLNEVERLIADFEAELEGFEEAAAVRYEVGQGSQQALLKAQLEKNQLIQRLHHIESARRRAAETLARLTNHPDGPRHFLVADPVLPRIAGLDAVPLTETAVSKRPEFAALEAAAERAARQVDLARKEAYPDFGLRVTYADIAARDVPATATGRDAVAIGASIKIPLQRGRINARIEEARLRQAQVEAKEEALRTQFRTQIDELLAAMEHEAQLLDAYESTLLPQATSTVEASLSAYSTGTAGFLDLLDAERSIFSLRTAYVDAATRYLTLAARLERVLGVRTLTDVEGLSASAAPVIR